MRVVSCDIGAKNRLDAIGGRRDIPPQRSLQEAREIVGGTRRLDAKKIASTTKSLRKPPSRDI